MRIGQPTRTEGAAAAGVQTDGRREGDRLELYR